MLQIIYAEIFYELVKMTYQRENSLAKYFIAKTENAIEPIEWKL